MPTATAKRTHKKNARRGHVATPPLTGDIRLRDEAGFISGVPAFHEGGTIHNVVAHGAPIPTGADPTTGAGFTFDPLVGGGQLPPTFEGELTSENFLPIPGRPGVFFDLQSGQVIDTNAPQPGAGDGQLAVQQAQLAIQQAQLELDRAIRTGDLALRQRAEENLDQARRRADLISIRQSQLGAEVQQRGQDIQAAQAMLDRIQRETDSQRRDAIARSDFELAARLQKVQEAGLVLEQQIARGDQALTQRGQDIQAAQAMNQTLLDVWRFGNENAIALGDLQLGRETEQRLRAQMQQQIALDQHAAALEAAGLGIEAQTAAGQQAGFLAQSLGQIEARRGEFLSELQANPRDFMQLQFALGGGQNILNQLRQGQPFPGQSVARAGGTPALGAGFDQLANAVTQRRDLEFFDWARSLTSGLAQMGQNVPQAPSLGMLQGLGQLPGLAPAPTMAPPPQFAPLNFPGVAPIPGIDKLLAGLGRLPQLPAPVPSPNLGFTPPPQFQFKHGGDLVVREPVVGMGQLSGQPLFTLVEDGKPETLRPIPGGMRVIPFQKPRSLAHGGKVHFKPGDPNAPMPPDKRTGEPISPSPRPAPDPFAGMPPDMITGEPISPVRRPPMVLPPPAPVVQQPPPAPVLAPPPAAPPPAAPPPQITGGPSVVVPLPPGLTLPPDPVTGQPGQALIPALPPAQGVVGEHQINPGVAELLLNNAAAAVNALRQAEAIGGTGPQMEWLRNLVQVQAQNDAMARAQGLPGYEGYRPFIPNAAPSGALGAPPPPPPGPTAEEANRIVRNFMQSMTPQAWFSLLPSQKQVIFSIVSALGFPPEDFERSILQGFPTGTDPSRVLFGNF